MPHGLVDPPTFLVHTLFVSQLVDLGLAMTTWDWRSAVEREFDPFLLRAVLFGLLPSELAVQRVRWTGR